MGTVKEWLHQECTAEREYLRLEIQRQVEQITELRNQQQDMASQLVAMTLRATSAEAKLVSIEPPAIEGKVIKPRTAADVRRLMDDAARKDMEALNGIR